MPLLVDAVLAQGVLRDTAQPRLAVDDGLVLRPWQGRDAASVRTAFGCPDIQRWHVRRLDTLEEADEWIGQWVDCWDAETAASWAVVDGDDEPLGQVGLRDISLAQGSAALSYWVTPTARGHAVAARSVEALSAWAFGPIGFNRLNIHHSTANTASCRVAARTGYHHEGTLRQAIMHADGWHDWHLHGRLRTDT
ncbi:RimJ/RimL family protein N-acetyltransferase [Kribbella sp. VKM Ac-2571]|uniref:GNAT family N-acetyltransferase n=1 Tax=Kribbella sp. VKM Ac-2571 TaxID=2512222 RepID=UPI00105B8F1F|nr:GNAT family N-acetyltransferase [Kribbella sp. VKM Ac-2571]TDO59953.1 RimJ/RimL family protein N-acetyltransferase [Kribbella sp. VKM Ac-2571]